jgi:dolichol-phosphate mannosyltransferase
MLLFTLVLRLIASALLPLIPEEAYYWMYSQHPQLSYYDHPPMVAWVIRLGTAIFGHNEWGVRIVGNAMTIAAIGLMYAFSRLWVNKAAAIIAAGSLIVMPIYLWTGFICTMESQLCFFWIISLLGASIALRSTRRSAWMGWYLAGLGLGGAMLSKYTGIFVGAGIGLSLLVHKPWRKHLLSPHPWIAAGLGLCMFTPVVLWNYRHHWASFRYQFVDREEQHPFRSWMTLWSICNFVLFQVLAVTPLLFFVWLDTFRLRDRKWLSRLRRRPVVIFSTLTALPMLGSMAWKSILFDVHFNWTTPAYLSLLPLIGATVASRWRLSRSNRESWTTQQARVRRIWDRSIAATVGACVIGNIACLLFLMFITPWTGHPASFGRWRTLAEVVQRYESQLEAQTGREAVVIGRGKYRLASELAFYRWPFDPQDPSSQFTSSQWFLGDVDGLCYEYWINPTGWVGRDCIYVTDKDDIAAVVEPRFREVTMVEDKQLHDMGHGILYHLAICRGLKG